MADDCLWLWFIQKQYRDTLLSVTILGKKELMLHSKFKNPEAFSVSNGWNSSKYIATVNTAFSY